MLSPRLLPGFFLLSGCTALGRSGISGVAFSTPARIAFSTLLTSTLPTSTKKIGIPVSWHMGLPVSWASSMLSSIIFSVALGTSSVSESYAFCKASFTSGGILRTKSIFKDDSTNGKTYTSATVYINISSGSITTEISFNGGASWQTITLGVSTSATVSGSDIKLRITENDTSTAEITNIKVVANAS